MNAANPAIRLAHWVRQRYRYGALAPLTHLKLQKLAFYCYGAAMAEDLDGPLPGVEFEAWQHGPVQRAIWEAFKAHGASPLPDPREPPVELPSPLAEVMQDALDVYGLMHPWPLREQSHLESIWVETHAAGLRVMHRDGMRAWAKARFATERVEWPEYLAGLSSMRLDGVPVVPHRSLRDLADTARDWYFDRHPHAAPSL